MPKIETLEQHLAGLGEPRASTVQAVIDAVQTGHPEATVKIAWNVPQIQIDGKYVMGISAAKNHISISPWSQIAMGLYAAELAQYEPTDNLFRVPVDWQVDATLITALVDARLDELAGKLG